MQIVNKNGPFILRNDPARRAGEHVEGSSNALLKWFLEAISKTELMSF